ncbi:MAG: M42 family metallopeptidase [Desulfurococcaceae archaeon]|uniref:M42 family peptidase n=1 Tax=Staphylothermus marinus TaxID=2280 RepID=A0A7C4HD97_STAMA
MSELREEVYILLKKLCEAIGPSGYEDDVRSIVIEEFKKTADELRLDALGNVIAIKKGSGEARLMLAAHMDEIGFFVSHIDDNGFIRFVPIGGIVERASIFQRVLIKTRDGRLIRGVIGMKPPHVAKKEELEKIPEFKDLYIDIGVSSKDEAEKMGVRIGDIIVYERDLVRYGNDNITGKALDDRSGLAVLIKAFELIEKPSVDVYAVATVQEEVGLKGARTAAYSITPDAAIALDVTIASDVPDTPKYMWFTQLGKGPAIKIVDGRAASGLIASRKLNDKLIEIAEAEKIPYQIEVAAGGTTDASIINLNKEGVPATTISIPSRYIHSPVEVVNLNDMINAIKLTKAFCERVDPDWLKSLKGQVLK